MVVARPSRLAHLVLAVSALLLAAGAVLFFIAVGPLIGAFLLSPKR